MKILLINKIELPMMNFLQTLIVRMAIVLGLVLLPACGTNPVSAVTGVFSGDGDEESEDEEEKDDDDDEDDSDERISILALDGELIADPRFVGATLDLPPSYVNESWVQPGGEADHTLHHLSAPLTIEKLWSVDVGKASAARARLTSPPIAVGGQVFVLDAETTVTSYDAESGEVTWKRELAPEIDERFRVRDIFRGPTPSEIGFGGGVAFDSGRIFVTSGFGFVAALDAVSGEVLWQQEMSAPVRTPPTAYRGLVLATTITNEFVALEQETGEKAWTFQSFEETARILSSASAAAAGDLVVAPFSSGELVAFLAESGRSVWSETLSRNTQLTALASLNDIAGSPVIDRGLVYVVSHAGKLAAIDIRSGQVAWDAPIASLQMPWVAGDFIFVISVDSELVCLSRSDGAIVWVEQLTRYENEKKKKGRITWAGPVLAGDHLILVSSDGELAKVSPQNGSIVGTHKIDSSVIGPVVANETVYVLSENGKLTAYR
ncbi:MAG: PQQ-binding-like beta-propeller repeat protein [Pseudomonadota bacterium]